MCGQTCLVVQEINYEEIEVMEGTLLFSQSPYINAPVIILLLILVTELSFRAGRKQSKQGKLLEEREKTAGTITGAMLALFGFILAVSLSMADSHFEARRKLVLAEANAIGTSRLRALTVGTDHGMEIVRSLKDYTQLRIEFFKAGEDSNRLSSIYRQTSELQDHMWAHASTIAGAQPTPVNALLLSSLNEMFDLATSRRWALEVHVPPYVLNLLLVFCFLSTGMMGYYFGVCGVRHPILSTLLTIGFTIAILLVIDLNKPRSGFIRPEQSALIWVLEDMNQQKPGH